MATQETRLKKAHVALMKHPETALYSGIMMMGDSTVVDDCPTAYTNGVNRRTIIKNCAITHHHNA